MADSSKNQDLLSDMQQGGEDFEKVDAPGGGFGHDEVTASSGAYDMMSQDHEISTTTDAAAAGEDEAEADRFAVGSFEDNVHPPEPLISWGDEDVQPSAPVPDNNQPLLSFDDSPPRDDFMQSYKSSVPPPSTTPEPKYPSSHTLPTQLDAFSQPEQEPFENLRRQEPNPVSDQNQTSMDAAEGSWLKGVDPRVIDLIYWRDVKTTGLVFGSMLVVLLSLAIFSLLSVVAYLSLAVLTVTFSFTVYKKIMGAVQKSNDDHPFKALISMDVCLSEEKLKSVIQSILKNANCTICELRRLFLIEDMVDSIKFGLLLWVLTYFGAWFNGMTLIILAVICLFTLPKVYETYKVQIDNYIGIAKGHIDNVLNIVQSKVPFLKSKEKAQ